MAMGFEVWLKKQKNRDDRIGDLAKDYIDSLKSKPEAKTVRQSLMAWHASDAAWESYKEAREEWRLCQL